LRTGRLEIIKKASLSVNGYIEECQKQSKCMLCSHEFQIGDDLLTHAIQEHDSWVNFKLLELMTLQISLKKICDNEYLNPAMSNIKALLKPFNPFGDKEENPPNSLEYQDRLFQAPRCKKCNHIDPEYTVASSPPHKDGIKLKCNYCGDISVKD